MKIFPKQETQASSQLRKNFSVHILVEKIRDEILPNTKKIRKHLILVPLKAQFNLVYYTKSLPKVSKKDFF